MAEPGSLQCVADAAGVGESRLRHSAREVRTKRCLSFLGKVVARLLQHQPPNAYQLPEFVVGEVEVVSDPRAHPRVGLEEGVHAVFVACENDHELVALVLHHLKQNLDGLLAEVTLVLSPVEGVRLVDEQHPAHRPVKKPFGLRRGLPDVLADHVVAHGVHQVPLVQVAKPVQQLGHPQPNRGLAGAWGPGEAHVQAGSRRRETEPIPYPVNQKQRRDLLYPLLHRHQADQLTIERGKNIVDARAFALGGEIDLSLRRELPTPLFGPAAPNGRQQDTGYLPRLCHLVSLSLAQRRQHLPPGPRIRARACGPRMVSMGHRYPRDVIYGTSMTSGLRSSCTSHALASPTGGGLVKIVVTGSRGLLGSEIMRFFGAREAAIGWSGGGHEGYRRVDITNQKDIDHGLDIDRPDIVIHCAANPNVASCEADPRAARELNALAVKKITSATKTRNISLVFISTDYVFSGDKESGYAEEDEPSPLQVYGRS